METPHGTLPADPTSDGRYAATRDRCEAFNQLPADRFDLREPVSV